MIQVAELTDGVRLGELITALEPDTQAAAGILAQILRTAAAFLPLEDGRIAGHLRRWEPVSPLSPPDARPAGGPG